MFWHTQSHIGWLCPIFFIVASLLSYTYYILNLQIQSNKFVPNNVNTGIKKIRKSYQFKYFIFSYGLVKIVLQCAFHWGQTAAEPSVKQSTYWRSLPSQEIQMLQTQCMFILTQCLTDLLDFSREINILWSDYCISINCRGNDAKFNDDKLIDVIHVSKWMIGD